jgi:hypothetical protein
VSVEPFWDQIQDTALRQGDYLPQCQVLRLQGNKVFGAPDSRTAAAIERINDLPQLEDLLERLPAATSRRELLGSSSGRQRKGRRRHAP